LVAGTRRRRRRHAARVHGVRFTAPGWSRVTGRPLRERRARLEEVVAGSEFVFPVRRLARNGFEAWSEVVAHDYEGLVAKDEVSLYEAGPTRRWLKVKQRDWTVEEDHWQRRISAGS
jgi:ATP-dependent DNA ligase